MERGTFRIIEREEEKRARLGFTSTTFSVFIPVFSLSFIFFFSFARPRLWLRAFETRADADTVACPSHGLITRGEPVEIARESVTTITSHEMIKSKSKLWNMDR